MSKVLPWAIPAPNRSTLEKGAPSLSGPFNGQSPKAAGALTCDEVENRAGEQFTHPIDGEPKAYSMIPTCSSAA